MLGGLATIGYSDTRTEQELQGIMRVNKLALLIDTRLNPSCSWSHLWIQRCLRNRYGERYIWRGDWLGNINYQNRDLPIQLADETRGIDWLVRGLQKGYTLILLCSCSDYDRCHRKVIYEAVKQTLQDQLKEYSLGQRVLTPYGVGRIDECVPLNVHRARNRYAVVLDIPNPNRYFFPDELQSLDVVQSSLIV